MKQFSLSRLVLSALFLVFVAANALAQVAPAAPQTPVSPAQPVAPTAPVPGIKSHSERFVFKNDWDPTLVGHRQNDPCRVFIGVGTMTEDGKLKVSYTVDNTPANTYGVLAGDVILAIDNVPVTTQIELERQRDTHQEGDAFTLTIVREGEQTIINAKFKTCTKEERDPCKVFMGVYTTETSNGQGVRVTGIIDETPAKLGGVQPGDIITAVDGAPIPNYQQLRIERDKHEPGDDFQLTVMRDGVPTTIEATFKTCDEDQPNVIEEKVTILEEKSPFQENDPSIQQQNLLELTDFNAYPNPTYGPLNVRFESEALPTTIRIFDVTGKVVYDKVLNQFNGSFNEQINLVNNKPGNFILQVQQEGKTFAKKIVLMPRA